MTDNVAPFWTPEKLEKARILENFFARVSGSSAEELKGMLADLTSKVEGVDNDL